MRHLITHAQAHAARMEHRFIPGIGYVQLGSPPLPNKPVHACHRCEPMAVAADKSCHFLNPPIERGAPPVMMRWHSTKREWTPLHEGAGNRVGFTSEYLAAHGWCYIGPMSAG